MIRFFEIARRESLKSNGCRIRVGAVITKGGKIIAKGHNKCKTHPLVKTFSLHAEADAIISRRHHSGGLDGTTIYIYRETADGKPALAKPCKECMKLIVAARIKTVWYSCAEPPYYKVIFIGRND